MVSILARIANYSMQNYKWSSIFEHSWYKFMQTLFYDQ